MTAVSPEVRPFRVSHVMSIEELIRKCREFGAVFTRGGTERFLIEDHLPAGAMHPHDYDEAGLRTFCLNRMR